MSVKISIDKGSLNMTMKSLDKKAKQINAAASEGLESVAIDILADSQATLKENKNIATGKLINSGGVAIKEVQKLLKLHIGGIVGKMTLAAINGADQERLFKANIS